MEIIVNACIISVLGMLFVFFFLGIQVWLTNVSAKIAARYTYLLPDPEKTQKRPSAPKAAAPSAIKTNDGEVVAVISAALQKHTGK